MFWLCTYIYILTCYHFFNNQNWVLISSKWYITCCPTLLSQARVVVSPASLRGFGRQLFIISSKHLHQTWCQDTGGLQQCLVGVALWLLVWDLRSSQLSISQERTHPFRQPSQPFWVTPAQQVASPEGPLVGSQPPAAWHQEIYPEINTSVGKIHGLGTWIHT